MGEMEKEVGTMKKTKTVRRWGWLKPNGDLDRYAAKGDPCLTKNRTSADQLVGDEETVVPVTVTYIWEAPAKKGRKK